MRSLRHTPTRRLSSVIAQIDRRESAKAQTPELHWSPYDRVGVPIALREHLLFPLHEHRLAHVSALLLVRALGDLDHADAVPRDVERARELREDVVRLHLRVLCDDGRRAAGEGEGGEGGARRQRATIDG
eukprot:30877-Pelagococcus_subviridis.AAC.2